MQGLTAIFCVKAGEEAHKACDFAQITSYLLATDNKMRNCSLIITKMLSGLTFLSMLTTQMM